ncbi:MAG: HAD family hydrolase [Gaiellales bacterium]
MGAYAGWLFDLDGVLTATARIHARAWKTMFDGFLERRASDGGVPFVPFDIEADYRRHVDGKPRSAGVRDFLASRGVCLPEGSPDDPADAETVQGLGRRKNDMVVAAIAAGEVDAYPGSVAFLRVLRRRGAKIAVVSSSRNCLDVLRAVGIEDLFDTHVDGIVASELGLPGKPAPDTFQEGARRLCVPEASSVVLEDAVAGVQAGRAGKFGLVVGVDRGGNRERLEASGADIVVSDLDELIPDQ